MGNGGAGARGHETWDGGSTRTIALLSGAVLLGAALEMLVLPWISAWWFGLFVYPHRSPLTRQLADAGWSWAAGQLTMLAIRLPDDACATAVGIAIGSLLRTRSRLAAAACAVGLLTACVVSSCVFTVLPVDARVAGTLLGWNLLVGAALLVGERLGKRLRRRHTRRHGPQPEDTLLARS
jgi:hypothetical protein